MGLVNGRPMVAHWLLVGGGHFWGVGYIPVVLLPCVRRSGMGWGHVNVPCTCSATCCYAAQMSGSVASLYTLSKWFAVLEGRHMGCYCACRMSWRGEVGGGMLKFLVLLLALRRNKEKGLSTCSNEMNPKPTRNANFANFSRENLAQFGLQKCMFRCGENVFF